MIAALTSLFAHQGGWDEALMVATPVVVIGGLLVLANRRASHALSIAPNPGAATDDDPAADVGTTPNHTDTDTGRDTNADGPGAAPTGKNRSDSGGPEGVGDP